MDGGSGLLQSLSREQETRVCSVHTEEGRVSNVGGHMCGSPLHMHHWLLRIILLEACHQESTRTTILSDLSKASDKVHSNAASDDHGHPWLVVQECIVSKYHDTPHTHETTTDDEVLPFAPTAAVKRTVSASTALWDADYTRSRSGSESRPRPRAKPTLKTAKPTIRAHMLRSFPL